MSRDASTSDDQVIAGILNGQQERFEILVQRYLPVVQAVAGAQLYNATDVDDAAQETFLRAFQRLDQLRDRKKFAPWLTTITRNVTTTFLRQRGRDRELAQVSVANEPSKTPDFARSELREMVRNQIESLDADAREVLLLKYFAGKRTREIAEVLDVSHAAVRKRLERARKALSRQLLDALQDDEDVRRIREQQSRAIVKSVLGVGAAWSTVNAGSAAASAGAGLSAIGITGLAAATGATFSKALIAAVVLAAITGTLLTTQLMSTNTEQEKSEPIASAPVVEDPPPSRNADTPPTPLPAPADTAVAEVVESREGIRVTGSILQTDGTPIPHAQVFGGYWGHRPRLSKLETTADDNGAYTLYLEKPWERFLVYAEKEGYARFRSTSVEVPQSGVTDLDYTLYREATVDGVVVDAQGAVLPNMPVTIFNRDAENILWTHATESDDQGRFKLTGLIPGGHSLAVVEESAYDADMEDLRVEIKEGDHLTDLRVPYSGEGMTISGRVTDAKGNPIKGVFLQALNGNHPRDDYSDESGNYRIAHLPQGKFPVYVSHERYQHAQRQIESGSDNVDFVLQRRGSVEGRVIDAATGQPLTSFSVYTVGGATSALRITDEPWFQHVHDEEGRFVIQDVSLEKATVIAKAEGYTPAFHLVELQPEQHLDGITLALSRGLELNGVVVDGAGNPVSNASIVVGPPPFKPEGVDEQFFAQQTAEVAHATSDSNGVYALTGLSPGNQQVSGYHPDFGAGSVMATVTTGAQRLPQIVLTRGGSIEGVVLVGNKPQPRLEIMVTAVGGMGMPIAQGRTGEDGRYKLTGVRQGKYSIMATLARNPNPSDPIGRRIMQTVSVINGQTTIADLIFSTDTGDLMGEVVAEGLDEFFGNVTVYSWPDPYEEMRMTGISDGRFQVERLPVGEAQVTVTLMTGTPGAPGFGSTSMSKTVSVNIQAAQTSTLQLKFSGNSVVDGHVLGVLETEHGGVMLLEGELDVPEFTLASLGSFRTLARGTAQVAADGTYQLEHVDPGTYTVLAYVSASDGPDFDRQLRFAATTVVVPASGAATADFDLR